MVTPNNGPIFESAPKTEEERREREEAARRMAPVESLSKRQAREREEYERASKLPADAYLKALHKLEHLPSSEPAPAVVPQEPQSWLSPRRWLAAVWGNWSARPAAAAVPQCTQAQAWVQIGPAPYEFFNKQVYKLPGCAGQGLACGVVENAGIVKEIAVDPNSSLPPPPTPQISQGLFIGSRNSGIWHTTNSGSTWMPVGDQAPSLDVETIRVDPNNSEVVLAGTGLGSDIFDGARGSALSRAVGVLRSTDGGNTWYPIGPACFLDPQTNTCPGIDPDPTDSSIDVLEIAIDTSTAPTRVWAATDRGLWYSDNAADPGVSCSCTQSPCASCGVTWQRVTGLPVKPNGEPELVNHILLSPQNPPVAPGPTPTPGPARYTYYASVALGYCSITTKKSCHADGDCPRTESCLSDDGWYRSTTTDLAMRGTSWGLVQSLSVSQSPRRASLVPGSGGTDIIYAIVQNIPSSECGGSNVDRLFTLSGAPTSNMTWTGPLAFDGTNCPGGPYKPACHCCLSVAASPSNPNLVVAGGTFLYRSNDGGATACDLGLGIIHADHNALRFDPHNSDMLLAGNDGGIWAVDLGTPTPAYYFLNGNLATLEFMHGAAAALNYGIVAGGPQDQASLKGVGAPSLVWTSVGGIENAQIVIDRKNSNVWYFTGDRRIRKLVDGGGEYDKSDKNSGFPLTCYGGVNDKQPCTTYADCAGAACSPPIPQPIFMDPTDSKTLLAWTADSTERGGQRIFRTTTGGEEPSGGPTPAWWPVSEPTPQPMVGVESFAVPPGPSATQRSGINFAAGSGSRLWQATNASVAPPALLNWAQQPPDPIPAQLPGGEKRGMAIDTSEPCDANSCTLYAVTVGSNGQAPAHVFRSTDAGQTWSNMNSDALPDVAANRVVVDPSDPNTVFVATEMGIYEGNSTDNGSTWNWCAFMNGFPKTANVTDLVVDRDAGLLRAFTYGRSAWETQIPDNTIPHPVEKVNTAASSVQYPRIGSGTGYYYDVGWVDARTTKQNVYLRGYGYDADGNPSPLPVTQQNCADPLNCDVRVDDTSAHNAQNLSLSAHQTQTTAPYCARLAWNDDRLGVGTEHVYYQYACSSGYKLYSTDARADIDSVKATNPSTTFQPSLDVAIAWQAERPGSAMHDVLVRFFSLFGSPKYGQCGLPGYGPCQVNTSASDAILPATASFEDGAGNDYVFVAWQETDGDFSKIMISKYDGDTGTQVIPPQEVDDATLAARNNVALAVDDAGRVTITWSEQAGAAPEEIVGRVCPSDLVMAGCTLLDANCRRCVGGSYIASDYVGRDCGSDADCASPDTAFFTAGVCGPRTLSCPPAAPAGAQTGLKPAAATDSAGTIVVAWEGNVNAPSFAGFARTFTPALGTLKNDFRVDLAGSATAQDLGVARPRSLCAGGSNDGLPCVNDAGCPGGACQSSGLFPYVWRDDHAGAGGNDVYTRVLPAD